MGRPPHHVPLRVYLGSRLTGRLIREPGGAIAFRYDPDWLAQPGALPISLSLPLREDAYRGEPVAAVFENLLPDSGLLRRKVAERVGARGTDAYSLLARIGQDCVGALQFVAGDMDRRDDGLAGETVTDAEIARLLTNLAAAPLGLSPEDDFRISIAGAQEKTALLLKDGKWLKPHGTTPTSHIFKTRIGHLPGGIDLTDSVENEFYCLKLAESFGFPVNRAEIRTFDGVTALVIERFDRRPLADGRLLRLPQEDCCQALSVPPTLKYQSEGGPGMAEVLDLLKASDAPARDQAQFLAAQLFFWIIGATDGHAKNFSLFLKPGGGFAMTPLYDILSAEPAHARHQVTRRQMRLAMSAGKNRHYRLDEIHPRHFVQSAMAAGVPAPVMTAALQQLADHADTAFDRAAKALPDGFPQDLVTAIEAAARPRLEALRRYLEQQGEA